LRKKINDNIQFKTEGLYHFSLEPCHTATSFSVVGSGADNFSRVESILPLYTLYDEPRYGGMCGDDNDQPRYGGMLA